MARVAFWTNVTTSERCSGARLTSPKSETLWSRTSCAYRLAVSVWTFDLKLRGQHRPTNSEGRWLRPSLEIPLKRDWGAVKDKDVWADASVSQHNEGFKLFNTLHQRGSVCPIVFTEAQCSGNGPVGRTLQMAPRNKICHKT
eukprot:3744580-Amphidinium_carterae.1